MKLCTECRYSIIKENDYICLHLKARFKPDYVAGHHFHLKCVAMRDRPECGAEGILWEKRE